MWQNAVFLIVLLIYMSSCQPDRSTDEATGPTATPAEDYETNPYQWGFINKSQELVIADQFDEVRAFSEGLALVRKNGYWGYINHEGQFAIPARLRAAWPFQHGVAKVQDEEGKYGLIDQSGQWLTPPKWDELRPFQEGWASVRQGDKFGMIDTTGTLRLPVVYDGPGQRTNNQVIIRKGGKYGMTDLAGQEVLPFKFERLKPYTAGLARARIDGKYGYLSPDGDWQVEPQYVQAGDFVEGLAPVLIDDNWGLIDFAGTIIVAPRYLQLIAAGAERWIAETSAGYILLNVNGQPLGTMPFAEIHPFSEGLATFRDSRERWGYINPAGLIVIRPNYALSWPFQHGQARVATPDGMAIIDRNGQYIVSPSRAFLELRIFNEGLAPVQVYR